MTTAVAVRLQRVWHRARADEHGQGLVEYALIIAIVANVTSVLLGTVVGLIAGAIVLFVATYVAFQRQEVRA